MIEVQYEGQTRRFIVSSATKNSSEEPVTDLVDKLNGLSVDDALPALCTVGWDTVVTIEDNTELLVPEKVCSFIVCVVEWHT